MTTKVRQSNFELLRILCMLGVVTNHVLQNCYPQLHGADFSIDNDLRVLLMCMSIAAVNCFVMISATSVFASRGNRFSIFTRNVRFGCWCLRRFLGFA